MEFSVEAIAWLLFTGIFFPVLSENREQKGKQGNLRNTQVIQKVLYKVGAKEGVLLRYQGH